MKFVFEKDKEIEKLKYKITELENIGKNSHSKYLNENIALKQLNESLREKNIEYLNQIEESLFSEEATSLFKLAELSVEGKLL